MTDDNRGCVRAMQNDDDDDDQADDECISGSQLVSTDKLRQLLEHTFPLDHVVYAFGYGSGVISQQQQHVNAEKEGENGEEEKKVIDLILVVKDTLTFHKANLALNEHHYNLPFFLGKTLDAKASYASWLQRHSIDHLMPQILCNPGLYFNLVTDEKEGIKYGVVQQEDLSTDLCDWKYLYLAGRMHKPIISIQPLLDQREKETASKIQYQQEHHNLPAALSTALLLLSSSSRSDTDEEEDRRRNKNNIIAIPETRIYEQIASLSYTGDFRTAIGAEDPDKVRKLVSSTPDQLSRFRNHYAAASRSLCQEGLLTIDSISDTWTWDAREKATYDRLWHDLPKPFRQHQHHALNRSSSTESTTASSTTSDVAKLSQQLSTTVAAAARYQSMKGILTAGTGKSISYAARKLSKGLFRGRPR